MPTQRPFLTAEWRYLLILNYEVEASVLEPLVPAGTQLDLWEDKALVSAVGFMFFNTRVMGTKVPLHTNFEEVNLRFYVSRDAEEGTRRGVAFIKELVPRPAIAGLARVLYGENYISLPMKHTIETDRKTGRLCQEGLVEYAWRFNGKLNRLGALAVGNPKPLAQGSEAEFITEHYWGYTRLNQRQTGEYRVEHPAWNIWQVAQSYLLCNVGAIYGEAFEPFLHHRPRSAFLAEGSPVAVYPGKKNHPTPGCKMNQPLEAGLNEAQLEIFHVLTSPDRIQAFLDTTLYRPEYSNLSPLRVMQEGKAHCLDGGIFAAAALRRLGCPPLVVDIFPDPGMDDDHVLAIYKRNGRYGAVAKSNFVGLRLREAVYATLRELVMSYFEQFYNVNGVKTLRTYTLPVNLARLDGLDWETQDSGVDAIEKVLLARRRYPLISAEMAAGLSTVDEITYKAGLSMSNPDGLYQPKG